MAHGYRIFQQWDQWLAQHFLGERLLQAEKNKLTRLLDRHFGKHALLLGVPHQCDLLSATVIPCHSLVGPLLNKEKETHFRYVEGDFFELPILTGSVDLVLLPHTLELVDNPRQLLSEACRVIKPEGLVIICGFNPYSAWGLKKRLVKHQHAPWNGNFIHAREIKKWLQLADFALEEQSSILFSPPFSKMHFYKKLHFLEQLGNKCLPIFSGVYILLARAKVIPLTPIRLKWKQQLSGLRITTTMPGHIARQSK